MSKFLTLKKLFYINSVQGVDKHQQGIYDKKFDAVATQSRVPALLCPIAGSAYLNFRAPLEMSFWKIACLAMHNWRRIVNNCNIIKALLHV